MILDERTSGCRIDKWLWCVRIFKTRGLATEACRAGEVEVGGQVAKAAREVRVSEVVGVRQGVMVRTLGVRGLPVARIGAKRVGEFCEDLTPPEEFAKLREQRVQQVLARDKGTGRPTKRDRRAMDEFFGG
ncbi:RNA-binding protein [Nibricoccus aquaticus]|uniref:RNA-binding protein n=1 Tax=Nibricoccus aquaticus TaxID=2576891 RepID=A0A290QCU4_9BACT|nr:S4 domain-containing protein [Nibricoccus aquaticus]ATC66077.1 RNA-binding protein [Nibricoccus aquaticus]